MYNDSKYQNLKRQWANKATTRAIRWEKLAKDSKAKGHIDLAICAARMARMCRNESR